MKSKSLNLITTIVLSGSTFGIISIVGTSCRNNEDKNKENKQPTYYDFFTYNLIDVADTHTHTYEINVDWTNSKNIQENFNEEVVIPSKHPDNDIPITKIGDGFLENCPSFNSNVYIPETIEIIGKRFMRYNASFNKPLIIPNSVNKIDFGFLQYCNTFNQPITLSSNLNMIGESFLYGCSNFNQQLKFTNSLSIIDGHFLQDCLNFNQPLSIPSVKTIGVSFLNGCENFNSDIYLKDITSINNYFLNGCISFNCYLSIPNSVTDIGKSFMYRNNSFDNTLNLESKANVFVDSEYTCATDDEGALCYKSGFKISGNGGNEFMDKFENSNKKPYRNLVLKV